MNDSHIQPSSTPEVTQIPAGIPTLDFVRSQREQLAQELDLSSFNLPEAGYTKMKSIFEGVVNFIKKYPRTSIHDIFEEHTSELVEIFGEYSGYCSLPLYETEEIREGAMVGLNRMERELVLIIVHCFYVLQTHNQKRQFWINIQEEFRPGKTFAPLMRQFWINQQAQLKMSVERGLSLSQMYGRLTSTLIGDIFQRITTSEIAAKKGADKLMDSLSKDEMLKHQKRLDSADGISAHLHDLFDPNWSVRNEELAVSTFNLFICQAHIGDFADMMGVGKKYTKKQVYHIPILMIWMARYFDLLINPSSAINSIFRYVFQISGPLVNEKFVLTEEIQKSDLIPADIKSTLEICTRVYRKKRIKFLKDTEADDRKNKPSNLVPPATAGSPAVNALIANAGVLNIKLIEIPAPAMNFTIDERTGVVRAPQGWNPLEGCIVNCNVWYMEKKRREYILQSGTEVSDGIVNIDYGDIYGRTIYVQMTVSAPDGSTFPGITSISSRELSFFRKNPEVQKEITEPGAPQNVKVTPGNGEVAVFFTSPVSNGGAPITGYTVTSSGGQEATGMSSPIIVKGLTNGIVYTFTVTATNSQGESIPSDESNSIIPKEGVDGASGRVDAILNLPTLADTQTAWGMALLEPENYLRWEFDENDSITVTLTDLDFIQGLHDPSYQSIVITSENTLSISNLGVPLSQGLLQFIEQIRRERIKEIQETQEREEQEQIYLQTSRELQPYLDCLKELSGSENLSLQTSGVTLVRAFKDREFPIRVSVDRFDKKVKHSKNYFELTFEDRDISISYMPHRGVSFAGDGYSSLPPGAQRAYRDFTEVIEAFCDFIYLDENKKKIRLRKMQEDRKKMIEHFQKTLKSKSGAYLIVLNDKQIAPSFQSDRSKHSLFPTSGCPLPRYIPVNVDTIRDEYDRIRGELGESNKELSLVCLIGKGHINIGHDPEFVLSESEDTQEVDEGFLERDLKIRGILWSHIVNTQRSIIGTEPDEKLPGQILRILPPRISEILKSLLQDKYGGILPNKPGDIQVCIDQFLIAIRNAGLSLKYRGPYSITVDRNIANLSKSPQGIDLLWDRIYATLGDGTGRDISNGAREILKNIVNNKPYNGALPTDELSKRRLVVSYLNELQKANILLSYVRFSAVTMREVEFK